MGRMDPGRLLDAVGLADPGRLLDAVGLADPGLILARVDSDSPERIATGSVLRSDADAGRRFERIPARTRPPGKRTAPDATERPNNSSRSIIHASKRLTDDLCHAGSAVLVFMG